MCNGMSSKKCIFTGKKVLPNSKVQWNVFKRVYFYWEKSTPQFKIELISGEYFFPCGSKFFPGKYYFRSTFFPGNYYTGSNFFRGVIMYGYTGKTHVCVFRRLRVGGVVSNTCRWSQPSSLRRFFKNHL